MKLKTKSKQQLLNLFQFFRISESGPFPFKTSNFTCPPPPIISQNTHETEVCNLPPNPSPTYISNQRYTPSAINEAILIEKTQRFIENCQQSRHSSKLPSFEKSSRTRTYHAKTIKSKPRDSVNEERPKLIRETSARAEKEPKRNVRSDYIEEFFKSVSKPDNQTDSNQYQKYLKTAKAEKDFDSKERSDYVEEFFKNVSKSDSRTNSNQDNQEYLKSSKENGHLSECHEPKKDKPAKDLKRVKVKGIAAEFFEETVKPKKRKVSLSFKPQSSSTTSKPPLTVPNLIVNTLLNDVIDSIVNTKLDDSAKAGLDNNDDNESLESGEIPSLEAGELDEIVSDEDLDQNIPKGEHHKNKHTCKVKSSKPCPECIQFKFTGSKKFGPFGRFYNASCQYEIGFDLEISNEIYHLLQRKRVSMKLFNLTEDDKDCKFKINQKYVKFEDISNHDIVSIKFFSSYDPE